MGLEQTFLLIRPNSSFECARSRIMDSVITILLKFNFLDENSTSSLTRWPNSDKTPTSKSCEDPPPNGESVHTQPRTPPTLNPQTHPLNPKNPDRTKTENPPYTTITRQKIWYQCSSRVWCEPQHGYWGQRHSEAPRKGPPCRDWQPPRNPRPQRPGGPSSPDLRPSPTSSSQVCLSVNELPNSPTERSRVSVCVCACVCVCVVRLVWFVYVSFWCPKLFWSELRRSVCLQTATPTDGFCSWVLPTAFPGTPYPALIPGTASRIYLENVPGSYTNNCI